MFPNNLNKKANTRNILKLQGWSDIVIKKNGTTYVVPQRLLKKDGRIHKYAMDAINKNKDTLLKKHGIQTK